MRQRTFSRKVGEYSVFNDHSQEYTLFFLQVFLNLKVTQLLTSLTVRLSNAEVVLLSNASKCTAQKN